MHCLCAPPDRAELSQVRKKQPKHKSFWAGYSWHIRDPDVGISRTKTLCKWPFSVVLDREWPGCPGIWVGTSWVWKNFMQENFGLIFHTLLSQKCYIPPLVKKRPHCKRQSLATTVSVHMGSVHHCAVIPVAKQGSLLRNVSCQMMEAFFRPPLCGGAPR